MDLKPVLSEIKASCANLRAGRLLSRGVHRRPLWHIDAGSGGRPPRQSHYTKSRDPRQGEEQRTMLNLATNCQKDTIAATALSSQPHAPRPLSPSASKKESRRLIKTSMCPFDTISNKQNGHQTTISGSQKILQNTLLTLLIC